ncbi:unnamed protein product [Cunninghamella blakesleeana]
MHEVEIINTIEQIRSQTDDDVDALEAKLFEQDMKHIQERKKEIEKTEQVKPNELFDHHANMIRLTREEEEYKINKYFTDITNLNQARLKKKNFALIKSFKHIDQPVNTSKGQHRAKDIWNLIDKLTNESESTPKDKTQGKFIKSYLTQPYDSYDAIQTRYHLIKATKSWLEEQSYQFIDEELLKRAREIKPGGNPSFINRLKAFINIAFKTSGEWTDRRLEIVNKLPVWTYLYMMLRCGQEQLALEVVDQNADWYKSEPNFVSYLREYLSNADKCISKETHENVLKDYQRLEYSDRNIDPYKVLLLKIIGRCELNKKSVSDVIKTTEDYLWLQLTLIRENSDHNEIWQEQYTLCELQNLMLQYGAKRFDPTGSTPWTYFNVLFATGQYERGINYLYKNEHTQLEAVHFAIALMYYGLLRVPQEPLKNGVDLLVMEEDNTKATFNFSRLIYQHIQKYNKEYPKLSLQYLFLFTLYSTKNGYSNDLLVSLARSYVRDVVISTDDYQSILGVSTIEKGRQFGYLDEYIGLLDIKNEAEYYQILLKPLANDYSERGRYISGVHVSEVAGDYQFVVDILNRQLGNVLRRPTHTVHMDIKKRKNYPHLYMDIDHHQKNYYENQTMDLPELIDFTLSTMERYEKYQHISKSIPDNKKRSIYALVHFVRGRDLYDKSEYDKALQVIGQSGVIPVSTNQNLRNIVDQFKKLDEKICNNIPDVLLIILDMLYKNWQSYIQTDEKLQPMINQALKSIENQVRSIFLFVGMIQLKIPTDTNKKLNRFGTLMLEQKITIS